MAGFDSFDFADIAPVRLSVVDHDAGEMGPDTEVVVLVDAAERVVEAADPEEYVTGDSEIPTHEHWKGFVRVRSFGW